MHRGETLLNTRLRALLALLFLIAVGSVVVMAGPGSNDAAKAQAAPDQGKVAVKRAEALTQAPALFAANGDGTTRPLEASAYARLATASALYDRSNVEAAAKRIASTIPFPPGLNSASHLDWDAVIDRGLGGTTIPDYELQRFVQANALRDWAWYATNHKLTAEQRAVIATAPQWTAYRGQTRGLASAVQEAAELGPTAEGRAFSARYFLESNGTPKPSRW